MALISCDECGAEISDRANSCPKCGFPLTKETHKNAIPNMIRLKSNELITVVIACIILLILWNSSQIADKNRDEAHEEYLECKEQNPSITVSPECSDERDDWWDAMNEASSAYDTFLIPMIIFGIILSIYSIRKYIKST